MGVENVVRLKARRAEFELVLRCVAYLTASMEAPLGHHVSECVVAFRVWGLGGLVLKFERVLRCVAWLTESWEATLGHHVSEPVVVSGVWVLGGGC